MPRYDQERMINLVFQLRKSAERLQFLSGLDKDAFTQDPDKLASTKYHLIVAIEACIDICNHIISRNGYRAPEDYADTFSIMAERTRLDDFRTFLSSISDFLQWKELEHNY